MFSIYNSCTLEFIITKNYHVLSYCSVKRDRVRHFVSSVNVTLIQYIFLNLTTGINECIAFPKVKKRHA